MKRVLAIIDSEKYLLIIIDLMLHHLENDCLVDIAISDSIKNVDDFVRNIDRTGLFKNVFIISPKTENAKTAKYGKIVAKILRNVHISKQSIQNLLHKSYPFLRFDYDYVIFYDLWYLNNQIARAQNKVEKFIWIDDGVSSYCGNSLISMGTITDKIRSLLKTNYLRDSITEQYLFCPELRQYSSNFKCVKLHPFISSDEKMLNSFNTIFNVSESFSFKERFIYIDQPFEDDGLEVKNTYFLDMMCKATSKKNILVKPHPRSNIEQYGKKYNVFERKGIPWELILMNKKGKNILVGSISTALISPFLFFNDKTPVIVLLNFLDLSVLPAKVRKQVDFINKVCISNPDVFYTPKTEEELVRIIKLF